MNSMIEMIRRLALLSALALTASSWRVSGQDWPQWRGRNRDAAAELKAPKAWPKELTQKWKVTVGEGVATPALVADKLYVFSREEGNEVTRCLNASDGKELWQDKYDSLGASGPASGFSGPRSSPAVADGKVVTLGVRGMLSCLDAVSGKQLWRKDDFHAYPGFHPSSSPLIVNGLCIAQLGGRDNGALVAYALASGEQKWKWDGPSPAYASPVLLTLGGTKLIIAQTEAKLVAVNVADGKAVWEEASSSQGGPERPRGDGPNRAGPAERPAEPPPRGDRPPGDRPGGGRGMGRGGPRDYKAATPIVDGQTIITSGRSIKAVKLEKQGDKFVAKELWSNPDKGVQFNTPVLKNGMLYGLTQGNEIFCINAKDGTTAWGTPFPGSNTGESAGVERPPRERPPDAERPPGDRPPGGPPGGGRGRGGGGGYGSIVDAGSVLLALTPAGQLVIFAPSDKEFKQLASYKVSETQTHAYPVASGNRIFIKDKDSVVLWTVD